MMNQDFECLKSLIKTSLIVGSVVPITGLCIELFVLICPLNIALAGVRVGWIIGAFVGSLPVVCVAKYLAVQVAKRKLANDAGFRHDDRSFPDSEKMIQLIAEAFPADRIRQSEVQAEILRARAEARRR
jgi:hypothetical protein